MSLVQGRDLQPVKDGIQRIEARLDRQGGIINGR